jgi:hypothetical protein
MHLYVARYDPRTLREPAILHATHMDLHKMDAPANMLCSHAASDSRIRAAQPFVGGRALFRLPDSGRNIQPLQDWRSLVYGMAPSRHLAFYLLFMTDSARS